MAKEKVVFYLFVTATDAPNLKTSHQNFFSCWNNNNNRRRFSKISFHRLHSRPTAQANIYVYKLKFRKLNYARGAFAESEAKVLLNQKLHVISFIIPEQRMIDILERWWVKTNNYQIIITPSCWRNNLRTL